MSSFFNEVRAAYVQHNEEKQKENLSFVRAEIMNKAHKGYIHFPVHQVLRSTIECLTQEGFVCETMPRLNNDKMMWEDTYFISWTD